MSEDVFQRYSAYYDLLYRDKRYEEEADYIAQTLRATAPRAREVVEFGSGTGRHGRLLANGGLRILGVERSEAMVAAAHNCDGHGSERGGGTFDCVQGDTRTVKLDRLFDAALALFHVVSYHIQNEDVLDMFENVARHLHAGGVFFFDVWHGPAVLAERPAVRVKRVADDKTRLTRIAEPTLDTNASVVTISYTILAESKTGDQVTSFTEEHRMRYFFPVEISLLADKTGFKVERAEEFLTGRPPSESTWGVAYLLRKRA